MTRNANSKAAGSSRLIGFALTTALATATLTGCAASAPPAAISASKAEAQLAKGNYSKAITHAEAAVTADPRNGAYRAVLGAAYLEAGRFGSAATSFQDAIELGDSSPRNALSLALALTAEGKQAAAQKVLKDWEGAIGAGDLGLAYSLAGAPDRGVAVLTNALRNGDNTAKVRQNLAYSYALAGQWKEARVMASEDIPYDRVGDRMAQWAAEVHPELYRARVAALLSVPAGEYDPGQPVQLALSNFPTSEQLAQQAASQPAPQAAPVQQVAAARASAPAPAAPTGRIPVGDPVDARSTASAQSAARQPASHDQASATGFQMANSTPSSIAAAPIPASSSSGPRATASAAPRVAAPASVATASRAVAPALTETAGATTGSHLVQLGSFSSEKGARRAWDIYVSRYPELANRDMVITRAVVRGKEYYRVAAAGYDSGSSRAMCGRVNSASREGCIAYAANKPLPGAVDNGRRFAMK
jgi:Flp pilus assembly protein TadD